MSSASESTSESKEIENEVVKQELVEEEEEREIKHLPVEFGDESLISDVVHDICNESYKIVQKNDILENTEPRFNASWAVRDMMKILSWNGLAHETEEKVFHAEEEPAPSPIDSWATRSVPLKIKSNDDLNSLMGYKFKGKDKSQGTPETRSKASSSRASGSSRRWRATGESRARSPLREGDIGYVWSIIDKKVDMYPNSPPTSSKSSRSFKSQKSTISQYDGDDNDPMRATPIEVRRQRAALERERQAQEEKAFQEKIEKDIKAVGGKSYTVDSEGNVICISKPKLPSAPPQCVLENVKDVRERSSDSSRGSRSSRSRRSENTSTRSRKKESKKMPKYHEEEEPLQYFTESGTAQPRITEVAGAEAGVVLQCGKISKEGPKRKEDPMHISKQGYYLSKKKIELMQQRSRLRPTSENNEESTGNRKSSYQNAQGTNEIGSLGSLSLSDGDASSLGSGYGNGGMTGFGNHLELDNDEDDSRISLQEKLQGSYNELDGGRPNAISDYQSLPPGSKSMNNQMNEADDLDFTRRPDWGTAPPNQHDGSAEYIRLPVKPSSKQREIMGKLFQGPGVKHTHAPRERELRGVVPLTAQKQHLPGPPVGFSMGHGLLSPRLPNEPSGVTMINSPFSSPSSRSLDMNSGYSSTAKKTRVQKGTIKMNTVEEPKQVHSVLYVT